MKYKVAKSKIHGDGIFATQPIAKGEYISDTPDYIDDVNQTIASSFNNHDEKNANLLNVKKGNKRFLIAKRGIEAGEELTTDYNLTPSPPFEDPKNFKDLDERELPLSDEEVQEMIDAGFILEELKHGGSHEEDPPDYDELMKAYKKALADKEAYDKEYALDLKAYEDKLPQYEKELAGYEKKLSKYKKDSDVYKRNRAYIEYLKEQYDYFPDYDEIYDSSDEQGRGIYIHPRAGDEWARGQRSGTTDQSRILHLSPLSDVFNLWMEDFRPAKEEWAEFYDKGFGTGDDFEPTKIIYLSKPKKPKGAPEGLQAPEYNPPVVPEKPVIPITKLDVIKPKLIKQDATLQEIVGVPDDGLVEDYVLDKDGNIAGSVRVPAGTKQNRRRNYRKLKRGKLDGTMGVFNGERYSHGGPKVKQRRGVRENPDGSESTHLMRAEYIPERGWVAFPSLFQDDDGTWVDMSEEENWEKILKEATKRGEVYEFGDDKFGALAFGMGSWKPENQNYNLKRALELGYEPDETGHWPSVDYQTGMFLKSMDHPTAFKEYMYGQLNKDIGTNTRVVVNPEGPFGDKQLQYVELTDEEADKYRAGGYILEEMDEGGGTSKKKNPLKPTNSFTKSDLASLYKEWQNRVNIDPSLEPIEFEAFVNLRLQEQQDGNLAFTDYFVGGPEGGKLYKAEDVKSLIYDKGDLSQQLQAKGLGSENTIKYILTPDIGKAENQKGKRIANYLQKGYSEGKTYKQLTKEMSDKGWISEKYGPKYYENLNDAVVNQMVEARKKFFDAYKTQTQQEIDDTEQYSDRFTYLGQSNADRKKYPAGSFEQWQATQNLNERVAKKLEAEKEFNNLQDQYNQQTNAGANVADATSFVNPIAPLNINTSIKPAGQNEFTYRSSPQISAKNADKFDLSATIDPASIESINKSKADYDEYAKALTSYMTSRGQMNTINEFQDIDWDNLSSEKKLELLQEYDPDSKSFGVADAQSYAKRVLQAPEYMSSKYMSSINPTMQNSGRVSMVYPEMFFMGPAAGAAGVTKQALGKTLGFVQRQLAKNPVNWASKKLLGKELPSALKFATNPGNLLTADFAYESFKPDGFVPNLAEGVRDVYQGVEGGREKIVDNALGALWAIPAYRGVKALRNLRGQQSFFPTSSNFTFGATSPSGRTQLAIGNPNIAGDPSKYKNIKNIFSVNLPGQGGIGLGRYKAPGPNPMTSNLLTGPAPTPPVQAGLFNFPKFDWKINDPNLPSGNFFDFKGQGLFDSFKSDHMFRQTKKPSLVGRTRTLLNQNITRPLNRKLFPAPVEPGTQTFKPYQTVTRNKQTGELEIHNVNLPTKVIPGRSFLDVQHKLPYLTVPPGESSNFGRTFDAFLDNRVLGRGKPISLAQGNDAMTFNPKSGGLMDSNTRYWANRIRGVDPKPEQFFDSMKRQIATDQGEFVGFANQDAKLGVFPRVGPEVKTYDQGLDLSITSEGKLPFDQFDPKAPYLSDDPFTGNKRFNFRGRTLSQSEGTKDFRNLITKYPFLNLDTPSVFFHGTTSGTLPGFSSLQGLMNQGALNKAGVVPMSGENFLGAQGINQNLLSTVDFKNIDEAVGYSLMDAGRSPSQNFSDWWGKNRLSYVKDYSPKGMMPPPEFYDDLYTKGYEQYEKASGIEKSLLDEKFPVLFGINPTKGDASRFVIPSSDISGEMGIKGKVDFNEIPQIFVPRSKMDIAREYLPNEFSSKISPIDPFFQGTPGKQMWGKQLNLRNKYKDLGYKKGGFVDIELTNEEALMYAQNGYVVEEIN